MTTSTSSSDGKPANEVQAAQAALATKIQATLAHSQAREDNFVQVQTENTALKAKIEEMDTVHAARKSRNKALEAEFAELKAENESSRAQMSTFTNLSAQLTSHVAEACKRTNSAMGPRVQDLAATSSNSENSLTLDPYQSSSPVDEADALEGCPETNDPTVAGKNPGSLEK
ncbi:MAG: hypothetical protein Q9228_001074 [Teloschistes exilis]